ncbi:MAG TPA: inositol monophosphatase family protein [Vicinamibacterales bacterium]
MTHPIFLATAVEAVLRAGDLQMARLGTDLKTKKKGRIDLVTEVDVAVERMFRSMISERFPDHQVVAEELGGKEPVRARHCWVFDPLDGTSNYAHGLPIFCSSLALQVDGVTEVAAVYDPTRRELFTATRGGGALLNGQPMLVSSIDSMVDALLVTGFSYAVHEPGEGELLVSLFAAFLGRAQAVRRLGSAALDLCYVAAGRFEGFWEQRLKPWDTAAGALIVQEAGGRVTGFDGTPFDPWLGHVVASNGPVHEAMLGTIQAWQAARSGASH